MVGCAGSIRQLRTGTGPHELHSRRHPAHERRLGPLLSQAQAQGLALGTYLRQRIEQPDELLQGELAALRRAVEQAALKSSAPSSAAIPAGTFVEMLLLLRSLAGPQRASVAQKEVEHRGLESWR